MPIHQNIYDGPPNSYGGSKTTKKWIVVHNTSNDAPAVNEASYAKRRTDSVSSHYYVDDERIIQSLNTDYRAFHVGSSAGNSGGIAYEVTGVNSKSRSWWLSNVRWDLMATQIRKDCAAHGIAPRLLSVDEIKSGKTGIMTHDQARRAWGGTDHTDPGPNFPLDHLIALIEGNTEEDDMPTADEVAHAVWTFKNEKLTKSDAYEHLRNSEPVKAVMAELKAGKLREEAILAAVKGLDTKAIVAAVNAAAASDARRDADLLAEVRELANGGADANAIVDKLAERLASGK